MNAVWELLKLVAQVASIQNGRLHIPMTIDAVDSFGNPIEIGVVPVVEG